MKVRLSFCKLFLLVAIAFFILPARAQFLVGLVDTTSEIKESGLWPWLSKTDQLRISGYFQPQFQVAQSRGVENFSGGDFAAGASSRYMIRRGRIRFDYAHFSDKGLPQAQVVFQFDGTERGVNIRDFWGRIYENKWQLFSFTTGMFARPFGFEVNLSSGDRETPERGRMSQILMKTERDLGAMATFEPRKRSSRLRSIKIDLGIFNGQGLAGPEEYDTYKDLIGRMALKPFALSKSLKLSAGASLLQGGIIQNSRYVYRNASTDGKFNVDSSLSNIGAKAPRRYRGIDAQLKWSHGWGSTEFRTEYWWGTQTSGALESSTPGFVLNEPYYVRSFNGAFFYLLQHIVNQRNQLVFKYDFYDPNTRAGGTEIGEAGSNTNSGDIRHNTFGAGYVYRFNDQIKLVLWYDMIRNENTLVSGYMSDKKDNIFTCRVQYQF